MTVSLQSFVERLDPAKTILFFGAGSSIPSGAPDVQTIKESFREKFKQDYSGFTLAEQSQLIENKYNNRRQIILEMRSLFKRVRATGGILSLPMYDWKAIYTTNYDQIVENVYSTEDSPLKVYSSNFDFTADNGPLDQKFYKMHGTIEKDVSDGHASRLVLTTSDYRLAHEYREFIYRRLESDLAESHMVIIGHSLADPDVREVVQKSVELKRASMGSERITLFVYTEDQDRASLLEAEGLDVVFGSIDGFFFELAKFKEKRIVTEAIGENFELPPTLRPSTIDVGHAMNYIPPNFSRMFNGGSASYADIVKGFTFKREVSGALYENFLAEDCPEKFIAMLLGTSGVGKTSSCRQVLASLQERGFMCWEHKEDFQLFDEGWAETAAILKNRKLKGILFIDNASAHLLEINRLLDRLEPEDGNYFKILVCSARVNWRPRVKNPNLYRFGKEYNISRLSNNEIDGLLLLVDRELEIRKLVERTFSGFSPQERRRRLISRCESDMFVCLKNIFASEKFDDIILREYAGLPEEYREVYRVVSALESAGVRVHRQMVIRMLGVDVNNLSNLLHNMTDIINEHVVDDKLGIYSWRGRHAVITAIIANYKFGNDEAWEKLFDTVIEQISPTYNIEVRSLRDMCSVDGGISRLPSKNAQNRLLRRMMSVAPGERIPRHRLIRNLIDETEFDPAETEIRIFENDFGRDGPVARYKINLAVARAVRTRGILTEDRVAILQKAYDMSVQAIDRYSNNVQVLSAFCEVGVETYKLTKDIQIFEEAIKALRRAEEELGDPEITRTIAKYERRLAGHCTDD